MTTLVVPSHRALACAAASVSAQDAPELSVQRALAKYFASTEPPVSSFLLDAARGNPDVEAAQSIYLSGVIAGLTWADRHRKFCVAIYLELQDAYPCGSKH